MLEYDASVVLDNMMKLPKLYTLRQVLRFDIVLSVVVDSPPRDFPLPCAVSKV